MTFREEIIGDCRLILGDWREVIPHLHGVGAIASDPPYGIAFKHGGNDRSGIGGGAYSTKFAGVGIVGDDQPFSPVEMLALDVPTILWGANHFCHELPGGPSWLVWDKRAASGHTNDFADCEIAWTNTGGVARVFRHHWDGMMKASERGVARVHPTQKPIALMEWCLGFLKAEGAVLDPFMGSGSTGVACVRAGRPFIGIEIDEGFFSAACKRIDEAVREPRLFTEPEPKPVQSAFDLGAAA